MAWSLCIDTNHTTGKTANRKYISQAFLKKRKYSSTAFPLATQMGKQRNWYLFYIITLFETNFNNSTHISPLVRQWIFLILSYILPLPYHYTLYHVTRIESTFMVFKASQMQLWDTRLLSIRWKPLMQWQVVEYGMHCWKLDSSCTTGGCT